VTPTRPYDALILEGGSLRCAFTAGVLDAFAAHRFNPFSSYFAVSAGSMALTSFLSGQRKHFIDVASELVGDGKFIRFQSAFSEEGLMNLAHLAQVVRTTNPIDWDAAYAAIEGKSVAIVAADCDTGEPHYLHPDHGNWMRLVIASCSLPLLTRGRIQVADRWVFDGGYADSIPLERALDEGNKQIVVVRTRPSGQKVEQDTLDWLASYWYRDNEALARLFEVGHERYNAVVDRLLTGGDGEAAWCEIAPLAPLESTGYRVTADNLRADYRHGLEVALDWLVAQGWNCRPQ
jgi:predicted patatin/cPLA2 family phospholipase